jgi:hypothetical protein
VAHANGDGRMATALTARSAYDGKVPTIPGPRGEAAGQEARRGPLRVPLVLCAGTPTAAGEALKVLRGVYGTRASGNSASKARTASACMVGRTWE